MDATRKIAIFVDGEVITHHPEHLLDIPGIELSNIGGFMIDGVIHQCFSTGMIEKALELGYVVYVTSTRGTDTFSEAYVHDKWLKEHVGMDHIFFCDTYKDYDEGLAACLKHLGIPYPTNGITGGLGKKDDPSQGASVMNWLPSQDILTKKSLLELVRSDSS